MSYCTQTYNAAGDIAPSRISLERLLQLISEGEDDDPEALQNVVDQAIEDADSTVDGYSSKVYTVPFNPVPAKVKSLSVDISVYNLFSKRVDASGGEVLEGVKKRYDDAIAFLKDVAKGNARIDGAIVPTTNTKTTGGKFSSNPRVFSKEGLDQL